MSDDELLAAFEKCTLPHDQWTHLAHVRVAYLYTNRNVFETALEIVRTRIQAYNNATDTPEAIDRGYHETITRAFMTLIFAANQLTGPHESSIAFCNAHPELMTKLFLRKYYSSEHIMTWEAKRDFVEPDLCPLPTISS